MAASSFLQFSALLGSSMRLWLHIAEAALLAHLQQIVWLWSLSSSGSAFQIDLVFGYKELTSPTTAPSRLSHCSMTSDLDFLVVGADSGESASGASSKAPTLLPVFLEPDRVLD